MRVDLDAWIARAERDDGPTPPWRDPSRPDAVLDAAYVAGVVPKALRVDSDFICPIEGSRGEK
jgi:hypothetical protein